MRIGTASVRFWGDYAGHRPFLPVREARDVRPDCARLLGREGGECAGDATGRDADAVAGTGLVKETGTGTCQSLFPLASLRIMDLYPQNVTGPASTWVREKRQSSP